MPAYIINFDKEPEVITNAELLDRINYSVLSPGYYYKITDTFGNLSDIAIVKAISVNQVDLQNVYFEITSTNPAGVAYGNVDDSTFTTFPVSATDLYGNFYLQPYTGSTLPNFGGNDFQGCYFDGTNSGLTISNYLTAVVYSTKFISGTYDLRKCILKGSLFTTSQINNTADTSLEITNSTAVNSSITNAFNEDGSAITNSYFKNCSLTIGEDSQCIVQNCRFENCVVEIKNGATVDGLTIIGTDEASGNYPYYIIDGAYQNKVIANWSGIVISGINGNGSSTVRAKLFYEPFTGNQGTYDENGTVYLINYSPIGVYEFNEYAPDTGIQILITAINSASLQRNHKIKFKWFENANSNTIAFDMVNSVTGVMNNDQIVKYNGATIKVGQIVTVNSYFEVFSMFEPFNWGGDIWFANYGCHYDL